MSDNPTSDEYPGCLFYVPWEFDLFGGVDVVVDRIAFDLIRQNNLKDKIWRGIQDWQRFGVYPDEEGRKFLRFNLPEPPSNRGTSWLRYGITLGRRLPGLTKLFKKHDIRVINCHFPTTNCYGLAVLKKTGLWRGRLILSFHGSDVLAIEPQSHVWRTISDVTDGVTACSHAVARQIAATGLWPLSAIQVIHNGIDVESFVPSVPMPTELDTRRYLLNVGNYTPVKAQDVLLTAFSRLAREYSDISLVLAGGKLNGEWLSDLRNTTAKLGLDQRVFFLTDVPHEQIPALMSNAICLVHTAAREGLGLVILEAGASGIPVIASEVGGIPEIINHPDLGIVYPSGDVAALIAAIKNVIDNDSFRTDLGTNLRSHVKEHFSIAAMSNGYRHALFDQYTSLRAAQP